MLVALAIASLALAALFKVGGGGVMSVETAGHVEEATERARSHLAALARGAPLVPGEQSGDDGGGFRWGLAVQPFAPAKPSDAGAGGEAEAETPVSGLLRVVVTVSWHERGRRRAVTLTTLRAPAAD